MNLTLDRRMAAFLELVSRGLVLRLPSGEAWVISRAHHMLSEPCSGRLNDGREAGLIEYGPAEDDAAKPDFRNWHRVGLSQAGWDAVITHRSVPA